MSYSDVIAAISTPLGKGGVSVIRISGTGSLELAERVFLPISNKKISDFPPRTQIYGRIMQGAEAIDDGMLTYFKEGASYTGEDMIELSCHGGIFITELVLSSVLSCGARPAEAGEFTRRAFLSGKISLADAESIGLLLDAKNEEQVRLSARDSRHRLASKIKELSSAITELLGSIYARIDYPDEDLGELSDAEILSSLKKIDSELCRLLETYKSAHSISHGIKTSIVGRPNVGKSSIYNILCDREAAIVTDIAGTTRDVLEETVTLGKVMLKLSDTAGIRRLDECDEIEKIGISRSRDRILTSELILAVFDASSDENIGFAPEIFESEAAKIAIYNKMDKTDGSFTRPSARGFDKTLFISAKASPRDARNIIEKAVSELFECDKISLSDRAVVSSARQRAELIEARSAVEAAISAFSSGVFTDAASSDLEIALGAVMRVDGRAVSEAVVNDIFSRFCVGK